MKKRILSMLLLAAMIVTAIPVMATAAGAESASTIEYAAYEDLYVDDHLENLHMAFVGDTSSVYIAPSGSNGSTWGNKVAGGERAWFKNDGYRWRIGARGGVGYEINYGYLDENGAFVGQKFSGQQSGNQALFFNGVAAADDGLSALPDEDVTIEYVAEYLPIYVASDATGKTAAVDENGNKVQAYGAIKADGSAYYSGLPGMASWPVESIGWFQAYTDNVDASTWSGGRNAMHYMFNNRLWTSGGMGNWLCGSAWNGNAGLNIQGNPFRKLGGIYSYAYVIDETVTTEEGVTTTTALFELYRNGALYKSNASDINSTAKTGSAAYYNLADKGNGNSFFLSCGTPTEFYVVRIYSDLLTADEKAQNHMVDVLAFYDVKVLDKDIVIEGLMANKDLFAEIGFAKDDAEYKATKLYIEGVILRMQPNYAEQLYVTDGAVGFFSAFNYADATDAVKSGVWENRVAGSSYNASLKAVHGSWKQGDFGGIGFDIFLGQIADDGTPAATSKYSTHKDQTTRLEFNVALLPAGDYTIDYLALYRHLYVADAEASAAAGVGVPAKDANGVYLNPVDYPEIASSSDIASWDFGSRLGSEVLGNFIGIHQKLGISEAWGGGAWAVRWGYGLATGRYDNPSWFSGSSSPSGALHNGPSDPLQKNGVLQTYSYTRDETAATYTVKETVDGVETEVTKDGFNTIFSIYRNAGLYNSGSVAAAKYKAGNKAFWMSAQRPADFFAVRVYDRVLTAGELMQNRAADIVLYYGLDLSLDVVRDDALKNRLVKALADATFELDAGAKDAKALELQETIKAIVPRAELDGYADMYVQDGLTALYTAFAGDNYVDLAAGTWTDRVSGATATLGNQTHEKVNWTLGANGGVGITQLWGSYIDGTFAETSDYNNNQILGTRLEFGIDQLPFDDYTVEYVAQYRNIMAADANGNPVEALVNIADATWPGNTSSIFHGVEIRYSPIDQFGNLMNLANNGRDKDFAGATYGGTYATAWKNTENRSANVWNGPAGMTGMYTSAGPWQIRGKIATFEISRDSDTVAYNKFTLTRDGATFASMTDKTINNAAERSYGNDYFYLGERLSADYYAVRIYERTLTAEERAQNRFVDILLYYGLEIPAEVLDNEVAMDSVKALVEDVAFETNADAYDDTQTALQTAIDAAITEITVVIGNEETVTKIYGDTWTAPATVAGKELLGWQLGEDVYEAGASIAVENGDVVRAVALAKPETTADYSLKLMGDTTLGMRFTATLSKADYLSLLGAYGAENVSLGMLITPAQYVERAGVFTKEGLTAWAQGLGSSETPYVDIALGGVWKMDGDVLTLAGSLCDFSENTIEKNISFASVAYVSIDTDDNGEADRVIYGDYAAQTNRTVKEVMEWVNKNHRDDLADQECVWLDDFLKYYENKE